MLRHATPVLLSALLVSGCAQPRDEARDRREILAVEAALCRAFEAGDAVALRRHLTADFTLVDSRGRETGLAANLVELESGEPDYEVFRNHGQRIRLHGDAAIVTGITTVRGTSAGSPFAADFRFTDTWVRAGGGWKLAASHASALAR